MNRLFERPALAASTDWTVIHVEVVGHVRRKRGFLAESGT